MHISNGKSAALSVENSAFTSSFELSSDTVPQETSNMDPATSNEIEVNTGLLFDNEVHSQERAKYTSVRTTSPNLVAQQLFLPPGHVKREEEKYSNRRGDLRARIRREEGVAFSPDSLLLMNNLEEMLTTPLGFGIVGVIVLWSALWKLFALYRAASRGDKGWFVALFFLNTAGILEIVYLFAISPRKKSEASL